MEPRLRCAALGDQVQGSPRDVRDDIYDAAKVYGIKLVLDLCSGYDEDDGA